MLTWDDYRRWLGADWLATGVPGVAAPALAALATDSRTIGPGQWFVPITGESFDGHKFIEGAMARGASGFFYAATRSGDVPTGLLARGVAVKEPLAAFQHATQGWRSTLKSLKVLALTGSTGKTTTKEMLAGVLRAAGPTYATEASFNNEIGVPKTLQQLLPEQRYAALEFGARMPGNIKFLCDMAAPDVVGLLNVGVTHLGIFGSVENLLNTKLEIFRTSPNHAVQVAFADDPRIVAGARGTGKKTLTFGQAAGADVRLVASDWQPDGTMIVRLEALGKQVSIPFGVAHAAFPINAAAAAAMALAAGVAAAEVVRGLTGFNGIKGRYQVHRREALTIIDDTYNANPDSMRAGLETLARAFPGKPTVLVLGDMLELGDASPAEHRKVGHDLVPAVKPALLVTVGKDARHIAEGATAAGLPATRVRAFDTVDALLASPLALATYGEVLYAKGSNGIKLAKLVDRLLGKGPS